MIDMHKKNRQSGVTLEACTMERKSKSSVYLKPGELEMVRELATAEGLTVSAWIRRVILREYEERRKGAREEGKTA
jgi:hypothetical protein